MDSYIKTKIVGVTYKNEDGSRRQEIIADLMPSESLKLVDMGTPEHPEAIGVFDLADQQCGFLSKSLALDFRSHNLPFESFSVKVLDITGGDGRSYGCNIEITTDNSYVCQVTVLKNGQISIKTPLINQNSDLNLTDCEELYLFEESPSSLIQVRTLTDIPCGHLPEFACEQIRKRSSTLEEYTVHVIETRSKPEAYCKVHIEPGLNPFVRKQAADQAEAKRLADERFAQEIKQKAEERLAAKKASQVSQPDQVASIPIAKKQFSGCLSVIITATAAIFTFIILL